jgi:diguanylate cyclase
MPTVRTLVSSATKVTRRLPRWRVVAGDRFTIAFCSLGIICTVLGLALSKLEPTIFLFVGVSTTVAVVASLWFRRPSLVWPWVCIGLAFVLFLVGGATRSGFQILGDLTPARSLVPDMIALPGYVFLATGLLGFSRSRSRGAAQTSVILDGLITALALCALAWTFVVQPVLSTREVPIVTKIVLAAYPSMSIFLVVVTLRIILNPGGRRLPASWLCIGAMTLMFVGDGLYMFADIDLLRISNQLLNLPYALALLGAGATAVHPSMRELTEPGPESHRTTSPGRIALVATALLVMAFLTVQYRAYTTADRFVMSFLFVALAAAVVLRIIQALYVAARSESRLVFQANHDELTGLPNRRAMEQHLVSLLERGLVDNTHVALLYLDLDRFKLVNDTLGHRRGDELLIQVAHRLQSHVRPTDLVTRIGGDEFMILLDHVVTVSEAMDLADRLRLCLQEPFVLGGVEFFLSASVGLAFASGDDPSATAEALVRDADTAMYQAKESGRDKVAVFDESMRSQVSERVELEHDLRNAVPLNQLHVVYQPIVGLRHGQSVGMEALVRWAHPTRGVLLPAQFIPVAEESGIIAEIGDWILEEAVRQLAAWYRYSPEMAEMYVSVNLSSAQLRNEGIVDRVADLLACYGLPGSSLCLELTESMAMQDPVAAAELLRRLRRLGVGVALDDFGAEYSSLAYLKRLPATMLKIDKSFVDSLVHEDTSDASLIAAVVAMAKSLGITTVAEGVESTLQAHRLLELGVDAVQGFLFSRPVSKDQFLDVALSLRQRRLRLVASSSR